MSSSSNEGSSPNYTTDDTSMDNTTTDGTTTDHSATDDPIPPHETTAPVRTWPDLVVWLGEAVEGLSVQSARFPPFYAHGPPPGSLGDVFLAVARQAVQSVADRLTGEDLMVEFAENPDRATGNTTQPIENLPAAMSEICENVTTAHHRLSEAINDYRTTLRDAMGSLCTDEHLTIYREVQQGRHSDAPPHLVGPVLGVVLAIMSRERASSPEGSNDPENI